MLKKFLISHKIKLIALIAVIITVTGLGFLYIQKGARAATDCGSAPSFPAFNIWPLNYGNVDCTDLPMVDVKALSGSGRSAYSADQSQHDQGITVAPGDRVRVRLYIHNGASPANQTVATARGVFLATQIDAAQSTTHNVSSAFAASNANSAYSFDSQHGGDIKIASTSPTTLVYEAGSTNACISQQAAQ